MKPFIASAMGLGLAMLSALPGLAQTQAFTSAPVAVIACESLAAYPAVPLDTSTWGNQARLVGDMGKRSQVQITFVNDSPVTLTSVEFAVDATTVVDKGQFAPGVRIVHTFDVGNAGASPVCRVQSAVLAGGSTWASR